ncbi:hypothetical protein [Neosynechococcus sphagnicola]|uniref:hypothetical protein n=1 Tax=Neosynechococcus sphagnicola TaxID=1501145 RepID=UPI0006915512|nr:hypothetical protein [Neosynechococcus sphagnicola]
MIGILLILTACHPLPSRPNLSATAPPESVSQSVGDTQTIKLKQEGGETLLTLKLLGDGGTLLNASEQELVRLQAEEGGKIKIKDTANQPLGYVISQSGTWTVKTADQSQALLILRRQPDGDYTLATGDNQPLYRINVRDDGLDIVTPDQRLRYQVIVNNDTISLRDHQGQTVLLTKAQILPLAIACFGFDRLSREQQAALAYGVNASGGR